jgi:hypothetical protein
LVQATQQGQTTLHQEKNNRMINYFIELIAMSFDPSAGSNETQTTVTCELTFQLTSGQMYRLHILATGSVAELSELPLQGSLMNREEIRPVVDALVLDWLPDSDGKKIQVAEQGRVHNAHALLLNTSAETLAHRIWYALVGTKPDLLSFRIRLWELPTVTTNQKPEAVGSSKGFEK